jgi:energy-coupling factor transporter transmembrane protein EcfT
MEGVLSLAAQHPLIAIAIVATAVVVLFHFVKRYFWRIVTIVVLTGIGYFLYVNGYFSKEKLDKLKSVDIRQVERKAEAGLKEGISEVQGLSASKVEKKADKVRDDVKKEIKPVLTQAPDKSTAARAAAGVPAKKTSVPAAGGNTPTDPTTHK